MTEDLKKKLNTTGAFDTPWLREQLQNWDATAEQRKADFMEHMYVCSGRYVTGHPMRGLYTGLWQNFCVTEAGPVMRDRYFEMLDAVKQYEEQQAVAAATV